MADKNEKNSFFSIFMFSGADGAFPGMIFFGIFIPIGKNIKNVINQVINKTTINET